MCKTSTRDYTLRDARTWGGRPALHTLSSTDRGERRTHCVDRIRSGMTDPSGVEDGVSRGLAHPPTTTTPRKLQTQYQPRELNSSHWPGTAMPAGPGRQVRNGRLGGHSVCGERRTPRSCGVVAPHTPQTSGTLNAWSRQRTNTGQSTQIRLARTSWRARAAPRTASGKNNATGYPRHRACNCQLHWALRGGGSATRRAGSTSCGRGRPDGFSATDILVTPALARGTKSDWYDRVAGHVNPRTAPDRHPCHFGHP
jgi:hypothetical protein